MGNNAGHSQVESHGDVHKWLSVLKNRLNKIIHELAMRTAMTAGRNAGRKSRTLNVREAILWTLILVIIGAFLAADTTHLATKPGRIPAHTHAGHSAFRGFEKSRLSPERISIDIVGGLQMRQATGHSEAGDFNEAAARHAHIIGVGMGGIPLRRQAHAPFFV